MRFFTELLLLLCAFGGVSTEHVDNGADHWYDVAKQALYRRLKHTNSKDAPLEVARNVIVFVGDGMGVTTLTAARILKGQRAGLSGEESQLAWDEFPSVALAQVNNAFF